jgi:hypothetical protein
VEAPEAPHSIDNIARFSEAKPAPRQARLAPRPAIETRPASGATGLKKGQRVRHAKYGEGTILMREGDGEDAKLTILFNSAYRHEEADGKVRQSAKDRLSAPARSPALP